MPEIGVKRLAGYAFYGGFDADLMSQAHRLRGTGERLENIY
jgi:hypothetical protein